MDSGLRWALAGTAATAFFTFLALTFPDISRLITIPGAVFSLGLTLYFLWPEIRAVHSRRKHRMVALIGMVVCGFAFSGFGLWYFWPTKREVAAAASESTPLHPDVTIRFVYSKNPSLVLVNQSSVIARTIKWSVAIWNLDDQRTYINKNPAPNAHDPLPIPSQTYDFLRPHTSGGPQLLFDTTYVKAGQHLFGSASVVCPDCTRGHTYIVDIIWNQSGWYAEVLDQREGELIIPRHITNEDVDSYYKTWIDMIPEASRLTIGDAL